METQKSSKNDTRDRLLSLDRIKSSEPVTRLLLSEDTSYQYSEDTLRQIFAIAFDTSKDSLSDTDKHGLIKLCLRPSGKITPRIFLRIISKLGPLQFRICKDKLFTGNKLPLALQLDIAEWMSDEFERFPENILKFSKIALPILEKLSSFKHLQGPMDRAISSILNHEKSQSQGIQPLKRKSLNSGKPYTFEYLSNAMTCNFQVNEDNLNKKRKIVCSNSPNGDTFSLEDFFSNDMIPASSYRKLTALFITNEQDRHLFEQHVRNLFEDLLKDERELPPSIEEKLISIFAYSSGAISFPHIRKLIATVDSDESIWARKLPYRCKLFKFLNIKEVEFTNMLQSDCEHLINTFLRNPDVGSKTCDLYVDSILPLMIASTTNEPTSRVENSLIPTILELIQFCSSKSKLILTSRVLMLVQRYRDLNMFNEENIAIPLPRSLAYSYLFSCDINHLDAVCANFSSNKRLNFESDALKAVQNSYIMDTINSLWRNKFFGYDSKMNSAQRAFFLFPLLPKLQDTSFSERCLTLKNCGALFVNPASAFIAIKILRTLEDRKESLSVRHEGPVTEESINAIQQNPTNCWLTITANEIKVSVLRDLDSRNFKGICDLVFNSLKSLSGKRKSVV
ncbi:hypothetical protein KGF56_004161 [Candida oxycetoniae]|uniref:Uncharacterized protein n=1 Tax=Candida oxycetoniae TaxID=497107 RepID=A0AAI9SUF5_9ASCO|nr:uncharacterized protein KGF56_004161 [Candida oxycetoniae]KAI3403101.2 hypothetical protein KGF56_004161 [Candida oxycetoniae]